MLAKMERDLAKFGAVECPACNYPFTAANHSARCKTGGEIVEAHPPERARREVRGERDAVDSGFFPLVSAAHEFKTPLVVMLGYTDLLRTGRLGAVNERQKQVLGEMQESAERLQKLIQDLLLLCELRAGKALPASTPEIEPADVSHHLREIWNYWVPAARQKQLLYEFHPAANTAKVAVESLQLQHIVSNLIENALKFTPAGGTVTVSATPCFWERRKAQSEFLFNMERKENRKIENAVRIDVSDSGPGIPAEHHEDIFWDFVQLPGSSPRGTGLGLAIARRLVEAHGGMIWVESELGKGSKFSLLFSQIR